jgi:hypothetical protein
MGVAANAVEMPETTAAASVSFEGVRKRQKVFMLDRERMQGHRQRSQS